jgi:hypothetical protein
MSTVLCAGCTAPAHGLQLGEATSTVDSVMRAEIRSTEGVRPFKTWATDPIRDDRDFMNLGSNPKCSNKI